MDASPVAPALTVSRFVNAALPCQRYSNMIDDRNGKLVEHERENIDLEFPPFLKTLDLTPETEEAKPLAPTTTQVAIGVTMPIPPVVPAKSGITADSRLLRTSDIAPLESSNGVDVYPAKSKITLDGSSRQPSDMAPLETKDGEDVYDTPMSFLIMVSKDFFYKNVIGDYLVDNPADRWHKDADAAILELLQNSKYFPKWINPIIRSKHCYKGTGVRCANSKPHWTVAFTCRRGCPTRFHLKGWHKDDKHEGDNMVISLDFKPRQCHHKSGVGYVNPTIVPRPRRKCRAQPYIKPAARLHQTNVPKTSINPISRRSTEPDKKRHVSRLDVKDLSGEIPTMMTYIYNLFTAGKLSAKDANMLTNMSFDNRNLKTIYDSCLQKPKGKKRNTQFLFQVNAVFKDVLIGDN